MIDLAAVSGVRDPSERRSTALSRGALVADFLLGSASPAAYLATLADKAAQYNAFNLLASDGRTLFYFGSREGELRAVEPGVHALSNHLLDEPWPKVAKARRAMQEAIGDGDEPLFAMLSDATPAPDSQLPDTGVGLERERMLSPALITGKAYGIREPLPCCVRARRLPTSRSARATPRSRQRPAPQHRHSQSD